MHKRYVIALAAALLAGLVIVSVSVALAQGSPAINWWVVAGGGGPSSGGNVTLNDTLGQPLIGPSSGGNVMLGAGYWYWYGVAPRPSARPVGGYLVPVHRIELLAPWLGLAALLAASVAVAVRRRRV